MHFTLCYVIHEHFGQCSLSLCHAIFTRLHSLWWLVTHHSTCLWIFHLLCYSVLMLYNNFFCLPLFVVSCTICPAVHTFSTVVQRITTSRTSITLSCSELVPYHADLLTLRSCNQHSLFTLFLQWIGAFSCSPAHTTVTQATAMRDNHHAHYLNQGEGKCLERTVIPFTRSFVQVYVC